VDPASQNIAVDSANGLLDNWTAGKSQPWLSLIPASGTAAGNFAAAVNCSGLPNGNRSDSITLSSTTAKVGNTVTIPVTLHVFAAPVITTVLPGSMNFGGQYSLSQTVTGGQTPYNWSLLSGTLCAGLSLSSAGVITGVPTALGTCTFTVQVHDAGGAAATQALALNIIRPATFSGAAAISGDVRIR
jgi:large repetitive protein